MLCAVSCELAASLGVVASERALAATGCQDLSRVCGSHAPERRLAGLVCGVWFLWGEMMRA